MKRRAFIAGLTAAAAWPLAARAQQNVRVRRIGVLMYLAADDAQGQARLAAFTQALKQLGWSDGRNLRIDTRLAKHSQARGGDGRAGARRPRGLYLHLKPWASATSQPQPGQLV